MAGTSRAGGASGGASSASAPPGHASAPAEACSPTESSLSGLGSSRGGGAGEASFTGSFLSGDGEWERERGRGRFSRERGLRCSRALCSGLGDLDLGRLLSREPRLSHGLSRALSRERRGLRALSRLLGGEHPRPRDLELDRLFFLFLLSRGSCEELPGLPERERERRRPRGRESLLLSLPLSLAFRLARSWLPERSLDDLRARALARAFLAWSSLPTGDSDLELLSPERERERGGLCALALPRELDVERERERDGDRDGDRSSTILWVVAIGVSGSTTVTQVTIRS